MRNMTGQIGKDVQLFTYYNYNVKNLININVILLIQILLYSPPLFKYIFLENLLISKTISTL